MRERALERERWESSNLEHRRWSPRRSSRVSSSLLTFAFLFLSSRGKPAYSIPSSSAAARELFPHFFSCCLFILRKIQTTKTFLVCWITFTTLFTGAFRRVCTGWWDDYDDEKVHSLHSKWVVVLHISFFFENEADDFCDFWGLSCAAWNHH